ncbi:MAG: glycosyltransferase family 2 protein [Candidatus Methanomethylophilaceae archaeon]|nr:glycosyltransferase family 2 protein [Candidatus Methanomethylophilaceae archaeon]
MSGDYPFVSIIIVNWNGQRFLEECFVSLNNLIYPRDKYEVILVDNASKDDSIDFTRNKFPEVKVIENDVNEGFCKPNNDGARIAKGEYVVFLNNDTVVTQNWLKELVIGALSDPEIACCASKILYYDDKKRINAAGGKFTIIGGGFYRGYGEYDSDTYDSPSFTGFGCGAGVLAKKSFFETIGGFDEDYFASIEEVELGLKAWLLGYKVLYVPGAVMFHKESGTFGSKGSYSPTKVFLLTRNRLINLLKNYQTSTVIKGFLVNILFDTFRSIKYISSGNFSSVKSILRGYIQFAISIRSTLRKRAWTQAKRKIPDRELYRVGALATLKESIAEEQRLGKVVAGAFYRV